MFLERLVKINETGFIKPSAYRLLSLASYAISSLKPASRLRRRHLKDVRYYEQGNYFGRYYDNKALYADASRHAHNLAHSGLIPQPINGQKTIVLSASSNFGITERDLQRLLGENYLVIANDLAKIKRCRELQHCRSDASFLPFASDTVHFLYDLKGALWYETERALKKRSIHDVLLLFREYGRVLKSGGYLVVDITSSHNIGVLNLEDILPCGFTKVNLQGLAFPSIAYLKKPVSTR